MRKQEMERKGIEIGLGGMGEGYFCSRRAYCPALLRLTSAWPYVLLFLPSSLLNPLPLLLLLQCSSFPAVTYSSTVDLEPLCLSSRQPLVINVGWRNLC